jgi:hypothetical protein
MPSNAPLGGHVATPTPPGAGTPLHSLSESPPLGQRSAAGPALARDGDRWCQVLLDPSAERRRPPRSWPDGQEHVAAFAVTTSGRPSIRSVVQQRLHGPRKATRVGGEIHARVAPGRQSARAWRRTGSSARRRLLNYLATALFGWAVGGVAGVMSWACHLVITSPWRQVLRLASSRDSRRADHRQAAVEGNPRSTVP